MYRCGSEIPNSAATRLTSWESWGSPHNEVLAAMVSESLDAWWTRSVWGGWVMMRLSPRKLKWQQIQRVGSAAVAEPGPGISIQVQFKIIRDQRVEQLPRADYVVDGHRAARDRII